MMSNTSYNELFNLDFKMFKKLVSIGLSLMMMLGVTGYAPVSVQAADDGHLGSVTSVEVGR